MRSQATAQPFEPRRNVLQFGDHRENVAQVEICAARKRKELRAAGFDAGAKRGAGQEGDLVAFGDQNARDRKQRIEMARRRRRSDENFHDIGPLIADDGAHRVSRRTRRPPAQYPASREADRTVSTVGAPRYGRISGIGYCVTSVTRRRPARGPRSFHSTDPRPLDVAPVSAVAPTTCCCRLEPGGGSHERFAFPMFRGRPHSSFRTIAASKSALVWSFRFSERCYAPRPMSSLRQGSEKARMRVQSQQVAGARDPRPLHERVCRRQCRARISQGGSAASD